MTKPSTWLAWLASFMVAGPMALAHCSGDANGTAPTTGGSKDGDAGSSGDDATTSPSGDDASVSSDDGGNGPVDDGGSAPPPGDASPDVSAAPPPIPVPEGGAPSDPGRVTCNGSPCDVSAGNTCCVQPADGGTSETCNPPNTPCGGGLKIECNEAADCNGGVCCQAINGIAVAGSTSCMSGSTCPTGSTFQACRVDDECGGPDASVSVKRCIPQTCTNASPMRTLHIESCSVPPSLGNPAGGTLAYCTSP
jgi:hypothetical protein